MVRALFPSILAFGIFVGALCGVRAETLPPQDLHLGVATCAGTPCHGAASTSKKTSSVLQNEYLTWQKQDKHARAYSALEGDLGRRIASNLGIGPATQAKICLDCHADNVPAEQRGVKFALSDGVGCEACHGAGQAWMGPHIGGHASHAELVSAYGLYPTDQPMARAKLCLGCHQGDQTRAITHRIMGAGHPRLAFELQTFSQIQPAHFLVDDIYRRRKGSTAGVRFWAVGQAMALERMASGLAEASHGAQGAFPELVYFDCQACHHPMNNLRWTKRESTGLGPGQPRFNDANAIMLEAITQRAAPDIGQSLGAEVKALHQALSAGQGDPAETARRLAADARKLSELLNERSFDKADLRAMATALAASGQKGDLASYAAAEQATMAMASIIGTLKESGALDQAAYDSLTKAIAKCYAATQKEDSFEPAQFQAALQLAAGAIPIW